MLHHINMYSLSPPPRGSCCRHRSLKIDDWKIIIVVISWTGSSISFFFMTMMMMCVIVVKLCNSNLPFLLCSSTAKDRTVQIFCAPRCLQIYCKAPKHLSGSSECFFPDLFILFVYGALLLEKTTTNHLVIQEHFASLTTFYLNSVQFLVRNGFIYLFTYFPFLLLFIHSFVQISQKSGAQVNVLPNSEDQSAVCFLLQGTTQQNLLAKCALEKLASDSELINVVLEVPQTAFGRIIGPALSLTS